MSEKEHCGFCIALARNSRRHRDNVRARIRGEEALWDQYERAGAAHRAYGRKKGR